MSKPSKQSYQAFDVRRAQEEADGDFATRDQDYNIPMPSPPPSSRFEHEQAWAEQAGGSLKTPRKIWGDHIRSTDEQGQHTRDVEARKKE